MKRSSFTFALLLVPVLLMAAGPMRPAHDPLITGQENFPGPAALQPHAGEPPAGDDTDLGDTTTVGTTWCDVVSHGSVGRQIALHSSGYLHLVWTNSLDFNEVNRHVFYNYIDPYGLQGFPGSGYPVESSMRAGFPTMDVLSGGQAIVAFHQANQSGANPSSAVAVDLFPHSAAFVPYDAPVIPTHVLWPKLQVSQSQRVHVAGAAEHAYAGDPFVQFYSSGVYNTGTYTFTWDPSWSFVDSSMTQALEVAASSSSDRLAVGWTRPLNGFWPGVNNRNNDVWILIDEDGLNPNFDLAFNLTGFLPPDPAFLPDTLLANMDTLRAVSDLSLFFDQNNWLHAAFTTRAYYALQNTVHPHASIIWHWSEQYPDEFRMIHNAFDTWSSSTLCGFNDVKAQRPSLGQDPATGYLYCAYQVYDTDPQHLSFDGWPSGEVYISVSTDGGLNWSEGINVTETVTPHMAPPGQCWSEVGPSMAKVVNGNCHLTYVLDKNAGTTVYPPPGGSTLNPVKYHKVPVSLIPATPLVPQTVPFHVEQTTAVGVDLVPFTQPIQIPAGGGYFEYYLFLTNSDSDPHTVDLWTQAVLPGGALTPALLGPAEVALPANASMGWYRRQSVPAHAPAGDYIYQGCVGGYPVEWTQDSFPFSKSAQGEGGLWIGDWANEGDAFDAPRTSIPQAFTLLGAHPNPFNPATTISFTLPHADRVSLTAFDLQGRAVATLVDGALEAGTHRVTFDGAGLPSGVYLYRLQAGGRQASGKMALVK